MKRLSKRRKGTGRKEIMKQVEKILVERGSKALELARKEVLQEGIECKEAREALTYFITEYWQDLTRPTLLSLACEAVGGDPDATTPIAVPMILISGAIDIHDDIIDQSKVKESRPTVLGKFGKGVALVVGDMLLFKGFALLYKAIEKVIPAEKAAVIIDTIQKAFFELGDAEALELQFRGRIDVTPEEYLYTVRKKAADVEAYTRISAVLGGGSKEEIESLGEYGRLLGMMMILGDDLVDMFDFEEAVHRVKWECLPLPILYALQNPTVKSTLSSILLKKGMKKGDAETVLRITDKSGGLEPVEKLMEELARDAYSFVRNLKVDSEGLKLLAKEILLSLAE